MIKIKRIKKMASKRDIRAENFYPLFYSFIGNRMYRSAEVLLFQYLYYRLGYKIADFPREIENVDILVKFLVYSEAWESVAWLLHRDIDVNYFSGAVNNINIKKLAERAIDSNNELYMICKAYIKEEFLCIDTAIKAIPILQLNDMFVLLHFRNTVL